VFALSSLFHGDLFLVFQRYLMVEGVDSFGMLGKSNKTRLEVSVAERTCEM
jgi:hypothetical protein